MTAVINRGGGRPSKGLRKYIGFRVQPKFHDDVAQVAAAMGMTVSDYVGSAVAQILEEDKKKVSLRQQGELPIDLAS